MTLNYLRVKLPVLAISCFVGFANAQSTSVRHIDEVNRLIGAQDCVGAEVYARGNFQRPMLHTIFGMIQLDCKQNRKAAVEYLKMAARDNESIALEMLMGIGESISEVRRDSTVQSNQQQDYYQPQEIPLPPAHTFSRLVQPSRPALRPPPATVIIQQPGTGFIDPFPNANKCIRDGGSIACDIKPYRYWFFVECPVIFPSLCLC